MKHSAVVAFAVGILMCIPGWAQNDAPLQPLPAATVPEVTQQDEVSTDNRMTPPPVIGVQTTAVNIGSEERSNYLRGGIVFTGAYSDNVLGYDVNGHPQGDASWSIAPTLQLEKTTPRIAMEFTYAPGFTFYDRISSRNEDDQNASLAFRYRLTPHMTFRAMDAFQRTSNVFNQPNLTSLIPVVPGTSGSNFSVIAPVADQLSNFTSTGLDYQFSRNQMVGVDGGFSVLHYPNQAQVPGLYDSSSQEGGGYYAVRFGEKNYLGGAYQFQRLVANPPIGQDVTQTHAFLMFYSVYLQPKLSVTLFGGPQHQSTEIPGFPTIASWEPAAGASLNWQAQRSAVALNYLHEIASSGGLATAVQLDSAYLSLKQMVNRRLVASVAGGWSQNNLVGKTLTGFTNGHTLTATMSLQQQFGSHLSAAAGYSWVRQNYQIPIFAGQPVTNREFISLSYQFERPLGR